MALGDKKTVNIVPEEAYGERNDQMIIDFPRSNFPDDMTPEIGMQLMMNNNAGQQFPVTIVDVREDVVVLDANHQLAGKELVFDIEIVGIDAKGLIIVP
jgi:peptidylprolyl isomerase